MICILDLLLPLFQNVFAPTWFGRVFVHLSEEERE